MNEVFIAVKCLKNKGRGNSRDFPGSRESSLNFPVSRWGPISREIRSPNTHAIHGAECPNERRRWWFIKPRFQRCTGLTRSYNFPDIFDRKRRFLTRTRCDKRVTPGWQKASCIFFNGVRSTTDEHPGRERESLQPGSHPRDKQ